VRRGSGETEFRSDILRKRPRRGNDACFNFHLLRFAIQLVEQVVDGRNYRGNVSNDELIRALVGKNLTSDERNFFSVVVMELAFV